MPAVDPPRPRPSREIPGSIRNRPGPKDVNEVTNQAKDDDQVTVVGRIGGIEAVVKGRPRSPSSTAN